MAKGHTCRQCSNFMHAKHEEFQSQGNWITYKCINARCRWEVRVFERK